MKRVVVSFARGRAMAKPAIPRLVITPTPSLLTAGRDGAPARPGNAAPSGHVSWRARVRGRCPHRFGEGARSVEAKEDARPPARPHTPLLLAHTDIPFLLFALNFAAIERSWSVTSIAVPNNARLETPKAEERHERERKKRERRHAEIPTETQRKHNAGWIGERTQFRDITDTGQDSSLGGGGGGGDDGRWTSPVMSGSQGRNCTQEYDYRGDGAMRFDHGHKKVKRQPGGHFARPSLSISQFADRPRRRLQTEQPGSLRLKLLPPGRWYETSDDAPNDTRHNPKEKHSASESHAAAEARPRWAARGSAAVPPRATSHARRREGRLMGRRVLELLR
ncbi:unnamed protein product [Lampetra fluviatilis]